ncbi:11211_t:CDS:2 [Ambispora leptoticha]|uniref:11211_t:CDS:1 n=1 Tax=Ambispora leptoticha TaxID=144679 RepID=A0A9N8W0F4_9GLOM|nr:11211_t:CDS:2 [Ambispora leptoticha]
MSYMSDISLLYVNETCDECYGEADHIHLSSVIVVELNLAVKTSKSHQQIIFQAGIICQHFLAQERVVGAVGV